MSSSPPPSSPSPSPPPPAPAPGGPGSGPGGAHPPEVAAGLRNLLLDGVFSQVMAVLTGGAFLVAYALALGASNLTIGLLAAVGPLGQIMQIPAIFLVERYRRRRPIVVAGAAGGRVLLLAAAALPWLAPEPLRVPLFLAALVGYFGLANVAGCAFNSWMRDFVPERTRSSYFGRRLAVATGVGASVTLVAGFVVAGRVEAGADPARAYALVFALGATSGLIGAAFLSRVPEPAATHPPHDDLFAVLREPFRNPDFRRLVAFSAPWNFSANMASAFFTVYMLQRIGVSFGLVTALTVLSQVVNVFFFGLWGRLADRYSSRSALLVAGPLFVATILVWPFTTLPDKYFLTIPLLVLIHVLAGVSTAGVNLCVGTLALKSAPAGKATAFLACNALAAGLAAAIAPVIGGALADFFKSREFSLTFSYRGDTASPEAVFLPAFNLQGHDFVFLLAALFGLYAVHRLSLVREEGSAEEDVVLGEFFAEVRKGLAAVSSVAGLRRMSYFPFQALAAGRRPARAGETRPGQGPPP